MISQISPNTTTTLFSEISPAGAGVRVGINALNIRRVEKAVFMLPHKETYGIVINNQNHMRILAEIEIDGKSIGKFVIDRYSKHTIERPVDIARKFTLYRLGTVEATESNLDAVSDDNMGLIRVIVQHEKPNYVSTWLYSINDNNNNWVKCSTNATPAVAGGTGLSSDSLQSFTNTTFDAKDDKYIFNIRLGVETQNIARPPVVALRPAVYDTPVPLSFSNKQRQMQDVEPDPFSPWV